MKCRRTTFVFLHRDPGHVKSGKIEMRNEKDAVKQCSGTPFYLNGTQSEPLTVLIVHRQSLNIYVTQKITVQTMDSDFRTARCTQLSVHKAHQAGPARIGLKDRISRQQEHTSPYYHTRECKRSKTQYFGPRKHHSKGLSYTDVKLHRVIDIFTGVEREAEIQSNWTDRGEIPDTEPGRPLQINGGVR